LRSPPEDVNGTWRYEEFLEALADRRHERHEEFREWIGGCFDRETFDPVKTTKRMRRGLPDWRLEQ
jgi:pRiA4b ORF-3-like protein